MEGKILSYGQSDGKNKTVKGWWFRENTMLKLDGLPGKVSQNNRSMAQIFQIHK